MNQLLYRVQLRIEFTIEIIVISHREKNLISVDLKIRYG